MKIVIPTYNRIHVQDTWHALHSDLHKFVTFVVRPEEAKQIKELYPRSEADVLPSSVKNIQGTRQYIWDKYSKLYDVFFQLDDDIGYFSHNELVNEPNRKYKSTYLAAKRSPRSAFTGTASAADQLRMFKRLIDELNTGIGMTSPRPNWVFPPSDKNYPSMSNVLVTGFYAFNAKLLRDKNIRFNRWASCGDTDACLQILAHGIPTTYCTDYFYNIDVLAEHSIIRSRVQQDHEELAEAWGEYIRPRRTTKGGELGTMASYTYLRKKLFTDAPFKDNQIS